MKFYSPPPPPPPPPKKFFLILRHEINIVVTCVQRSFMILSLASCNQTWCSELIWATVVIKNNSCVLSANCSNRCSNSLWLAFLAYLDLHMHYLTSHWISYLTLPFVLLPRVSNGWKMNSTNFYQIMVVQEELAWLFYSPINFFLQCYSSGGFQYCGFTSVDGWKPSNCFS